MKDSFTVVDIETTGDMPWRHELVAVGVGSKVHKPAAGRKAVAKLFQTDGIAVAHSNYDLRWMVLDGAPLGERLRYHDTKVMAFMLDQTQGELALDDLAGKYLGITDVKKPITRREPKDGPKRILYNLHKGFGLWEDAWLQKYIEKLPEDYRYLKDAKAGIIPIEGVPWEEMVAYNGQDLEVTAELYIKLRQLLRDTGQWEQYFIAEEAPLSRLLIEMEVAGMPIDVKGTQAALDVYDAERQEKAKELVAATGAPHGFSLTSGDDVAAFLYDELPAFKVQIEVPALASLKPAERIAVVEQMIPDGVIVDRIGTKYVYGREIVEGRGLKPPKTKMKKGKEPKRPPVDAENLVLLYGGDPWIDKYLRWKSLNTLCTNYLEVWVDVAHNGRLHGRFDQARAETGRIASRDPNLQAIPVSGQDSIRHLFAAPMMIGDYSGLDARVAAHFSGDPIMLEIFRNDMDLYGTLASEAWGGPADKTNANRSLMKILMLSAQYGAQAGSIGDKIRISGLGDKYARQSGKLLRNLEETLGVMFEWREGVLRDAQAVGYIETITGRKRFLPELYSNEWWKRTRAERQCVASMVQGTSADIVRRAMIRVRQTVPPEAALMILQVHDEILWQRGKAWKKSTFDTIKDICDNGHEWPLFVPETGETLPGFALQVPMKFSAGLGESWEEKDAQGARSYRVMSA